MGTVRDHLWTWGHVAGSYTGEFGLDQVSTIGPAQAAAYLGVPNLVMVSYHGKPEPPYEPCAQELSGLRQVVWSVVGGGGTSRGFEEELGATQRLAAQFPNITGAMMDDFFIGPPDPRLAVYTPEEIAAMRDRLHASQPRPLDLWVVLYNHNMVLPIAPHLAACDVVAFWTWTGNELPQLEENFARAEALAPQARKVLGCYMYDFGNSQPLPVEAMQRQCEIGLRWLREGRIEGMILLGTCIADLGLETVEWTRRWVDRVGEQEI